MDDVVEQGEQARASLPRWLRVAAVAVALAAGVFALTRSDLLAAHDARQQPPAAPGVRSPVVTAPGQNTSQGISIVVRRGTRLKRYEAGSGSRPLARLPRGFEAQGELVHVPGVDGTGPLVGVEQSVLFRASPVRGRTVRSIGRASRVVGASPRAGRLFVLQPFGGQDNGPRLVEVDARSGDVTDRLPFPGYDPTGPWQPAYVVLAPGGGSALLMTRAGRYGRLDLALAWAGAAIHDDGAPTRQSLGSTARLLGVAQTRILTLDRSDRCAELPCPMTVLNLIRDRVLTRVVQPPPGWVFGSTIVSGEGGDPLVVVARADEPDRLALARLAAGARLGLLVAGTEGLVASIKPAGGAGGSVVFALPRPEGVRLSVWLPGSPSAALLLDLPALEPGSTLVCACR